TIGDFTFANCFGLESVTFAEGSELKDIGDDAFSGCTSLESIEIPSGVTSIGDFTFMNCFGLESVTFAEGSKLENIGEGAFAYCVSLESIEIPSGVTTIKTGAFGGCYSLMDIYFGGTEADWEKVAKGTDWDSGTPVDMVIHYSFGVTVENGTVDKVRAMEGETVTITADDPEDGLAFVQWAFVEGVDFEQMDAMTTTFSMPAKDVTVTPVYKEITPEELPDQVYTGTPIKPTFRLFDVTLDGVDAVFPNKYDLTYVGNVDVGQAKVTITLKDGKGVNAGSKTVTFKINPADISGATVSIAGDWVYDGTELTPEPTVEWGDMTLVEGTDYTVSYRNNVRVGQAFVDIVGKGNFTDSLTGTFDVTKRPLTVTAGSAERAYDATALTADSFTHEGLADGDRIVSADVVGSQDDVGSSEKTVSNAKIVNADGEDVTDCYEITYKPGMLTVTPVSYDAKDSSGSVLQLLTWQKGSGKTLDFTVYRSENDDLTFGKFTGLTVDGSPVDAKYYVASPGSLKLSVKPEFLETLTVGDHDVVVTFEDGNAALKLTVLAADPVNPDPGNPGSSGTAGASGGSGSAVTPASSTVKALSSTGSEVGSSIALAVLLLGLGTLLARRSRTLNR
ncbi:MAG: leucine-rich repeat domain-containing protein, partial [Actinomycetaceae bacterium]|nr:leucine-rich repeat domain-containing protein [Actinomycetaceae bacterium]